MKYLAKEPHLFIITNVIDEHNSQTTEPTPDLDNNQDEMTASITAIFRCYNKYECFDLSLLRRVLETLLLQDIKATIQIKYGHLPQFKSLIGQVIFMMTLDLSNAPAIQDIEDASVHFKNLKLISFPGENIVVDFSTKAQRFIKIVSMGYALPYKIGSALLAKVEATSLNYFNQQVHRFQSRVKLME